MKNESVGLVVIDYSHIFFSHHKTNARKLSSIIINLSRFLFCEAVTMNMLGNVERAYSRQGEKREAKIRTAFSPTPYYEIARRNLWYSLMF